MKVRIIGMSHYVGGDQYVAGTNPESIIEVAGRICYRSKAGKKEQFIKARIKDGHESIIEHASFTFEIEGISRAASHQLVRHRIASYSQESQRYVDMSEPAYVIPPAIEANEEAVSVYKEYLGLVSNAYRKLRELGIRKEDARFILPNATMTKIVVTMNFRELRHFFKVRCHKSAQWEIRNLATEMLWLSNKIAPSVFGDLYEEFYTERKNG